MDLKSACDSLRGSENREVAALVVLDKALQRIISVWPMVRRVENTVPHDLANFDRMWMAVEFDEREVVDLSGLPSGLGISALRRAKGLRLIYPDGSVHHYAKLVLQQVVKDALS